MNIVKYNLKMIIENRYFKYIVLGIFFISLKCLIDFKLDHSVANYTFIEGIINNLSDNNMITWIIFPISLYYMTNVLYDEEYKNYITIRAKTKHNLFRQRVLSIFICNIILIFTFFLCSLIGSLYIFRIGLDWTPLPLPKGIPTDEMEKVKNAMKLHSLSIFPLHQYYSTVVSVLVILVFLIFGLTLLNLMFGLVSNIINNVRIGAVIGFIYFICSSRYIFISDKRFGFIKYFTIDSFVLVNNHSFRNNGMLYTLDQSLKLLFILLIVFYLLNLFVIKRTDASKGE